MRALWSRASPSAETYTDVISFPSKPYTSDVMVKATQVRQTRLVVLEQATTCCWPPVHVVHAVQLLAFRKVPDT